MSNDNTSFTLLSAVQAQGAGTGVAFQSPGARVFVYSAAGSSATVLIQGSFDNSVWYTLATITNPAASPSGETWRGTAWPYIRANVSAYSSGAITATAVALGSDPGAWAADVAAAGGTAVAQGFLAYSLTNAAVVAAGSGATTGNIKVGSLPAKSRLLYSQFEVGTQATFAAGTLTLSAGVVGTAYADWLVASDLKATAATVYGDAVAERGATNLDGQLYYPTAKDVYVQILAGAGDIANVTTCTGTLRIRYETYP